MSVGWYHPVLKHGRSWWDRELFPQSVFDERLQSARDILSKIQADVLLAYGDAQRYGYLTYLSHYLPKHRGGLFVLPLKTAPFLIIEAGKREIAWAKSLSYVENVVSGGDGVAAPLATILAGLGAQRLAFAGFELMRASDADAVAKVIEAHERPIAAARELDAVREIKGSGEQQAISQAAVLVAAGLERANAEVIPGLRADVIAYGAERELRRRGAEDARVAATVQPLGELAVPRSESVAVGGSVRLALAAAYQRYWAAAARTWWAGEEPMVSRLASALHSRVIGALQPRHDTGQLLSSLKPDLDSLAREQAKAQVVLSGIGLDLVESPYHDSDEVISLQSGMTLVVSTLVEHPQAGKIHNSDTVLITNSGARLLTTGIESRSA